MAVYGREDDLILALQQATYALSSNGRFSAIADIDGDVTAATRVTEVADIFVQWLRKVESVKLTLVALESQTGEVITTFSPEGATPLSTMTDLQQLRYVIDAADARGFAVDASLQVSVSDPTIVSASITEATAGTASGKDELVVVAIAPGSSLVKVFDPANPDTVFGSDSVDVTTSAVTLISLENPTVEDQPAPAPTPAP